MTTTPVHVGLWLALIFFSPPSFASAFGDARACGFLLDERGEASLESIAEYYGALLDRLAPWLQEIDLQALARAPLEYRAKPGSTSDAIAEGIGSLASLIALLETTEEPEWRAILEEKLWGCARARLETRGRQRESQRRETEKVKVVREALALSYAIDVHGGRVLGHDKSSYRAGGQEFAIQLSPDGRRFAQMKPVSPERSKIEIRDFKTGALVAELSDPEASLLNGVWSADGALYYAGDQTGTLRAWDLSAAKPRFLAKLETIPRIVEQMVALRDGGVMVLLDGTQPLSDVYGFSLKDLGYTKRRELDWITFTWNPRVDPAKKSLLLAPGKIMSYDPVTSRAFFGSYESNICFLDPERDKDQPRRFSTLPATSTYQHQDGLSHFFEGEQVYRMDFSSLTFGELPEVGSSVGSFLRGSDLFAALDPKVSQYRLWRLSEKPEELASFKIPLPQDVYVTSFPSRPAGDTSRLPPTRDAFKFGTPAILFGSRT